MLSYEKCELCPRCCGVNRLKGELGFCGMSARLRVARAGIHPWEEPCLVAEHGSGTVFFSGCTLKCSFCQNQNISKYGFGAEITSERLREIFEELIAQGAENINLVTPTHFLPSIIPALTPKLPVPIVYNCGGYERVETLRELEGLVDIYLPDMKYYDASLAKRLSKAGDYVQAAKAAISEMIRQTGPVIMENGKMLRGTIIRHLILPGEVGNSLDVLSWIGETFAPEDYRLSLMSQFTPISTDDPNGLNRQITMDEYAGAESWLEMCGIEQAYTQELTSADEVFIPPFDLEGVLKARQ